MFGNKKRRAYRKKMGFLYDIITNKNNKDLTFNITFRQMAIVPLDKKVYIILQPIFSYGYFEENDGIVCRLNFEEDCEQAFDYVKDENIINAVFEEYHKMISEEQTEEENI